MNTVSGIRLAALLLPFVVFTAGTASGQGSHSIRISDGEVVIDGRTIPAEELPPAFDAAGLDLQYVFSGDVTPVLRVGDGFFVLEDGRLREAEPAEREDVSVIFRNSLSGAAGVDGRVRMRAGAPPDVSVRTKTRAAMSPRAASEARAARRANDGARAEAAASAHHITVMQLKAAELQEQVERMQQLQSSARSRIDAQRMEELEHAARELSIRAEEAARTAQAMPHLQIQEYLGTIQKKNQALFDRLVDEREMEGHTLQLAAEIRNEEDEVLREQKIERLRARLHEIFDLKQDNRRREIEQLEERLDDLQQALEERERMRGDIVESRLRELLQSFDELNW